ncbi:MAG: type II secretion system protein [bacterium]
MNTYSKRGFTLIELLVVIAIIGILAGIVLVSLGLARQKGRDAAIQEELSGLRSQMELHSASNDTYVGACATGQAYAILLGAASTSPATSVDTANADAGTATTVVCHDTPTTPSDKAWAASVPLNDTPTTYWCVDSAGAAKEETDVLAADSNVCA